MDSNAKRIGSVQIPGGKMIAFQSAENDPYPGIEIISPEPLRAIRKRLPYRKPLN